MTTRKEAIRRLKEVVDEIYNKLEEMENLLKEVAAEELGPEEAYWLSRIDEALSILLEDALGVFEQEGEEE